MPTVKELATDKNFWNLSEEDRLAVATRTDPKFGELPLDDQKMVMEKLLSPEVQKKLTVLPRFMEGISRYHPGGLLKAIPALWQAYKDQPATIPAIAPPVEKATRLLAKAPGFLAKSMWEPQREQFTKAQEAIDAGRYSEAVARGAAGAIPILGPMASESAEEIQKDNFAGAAGIPVGMALGYASPKVLSRGLPKGMAKDITPIGREVEESLIKAHPGVPEAHLVAGEMTKNFWADVIQNIAQKGITGAKRMSTFFERRADLLMDDTRAFVKGFSDQAPSLPKGELVEHIKRAAKRNFDDVAGPLGQVRDDIEAALAPKVVMQETRVPVTSKLTDPSGKPIMSTKIEQTPVLQGGVMVDTSEIYQFIKKDMSNLRLALSQSPDPIYSKMLDAIESGKPIPFSAPIGEGFEGIVTAVDLKTQLGYLYRDVLKKGQRNKRSGGIKRLEKLVDEAIDGAVEVQAPDYFESWKAVNNKYHEAKLKYGNEYVDSLFKVTYEGGNGLPENVLTQTLMSPSRIKRVKTLLTKPDGTMDKNWQRFQTQAVEHYVSLGMPEGKLTSTGKQVIDFTAVHKAMFGQGPAEIGGIGRKSMVSIFGSEGTAEIEGILKQGMVTSQKTNTGVFGVAIQIAQPMALGTVVGIATGSIGAGAVAAGTSAGLILLTPFAFSRMLTTSTGRRLLMNGLRAKRGTQEGIAAANAITAYVNSQEKVETP